MPSSMHSQLCDKFPSIFPLCLYIFLWQIRRLLTIKPFYFLFPVPIFSFAYQEAMALFSSYPVSCPIRCSSNRDNHDPNKQKLNSHRIIGTSTRYSNMADILSQTAGVASTFNSITSIPENGYIPKEEDRQNIRTRKQLVDSHRQGLIGQGGVGYKQTVVIRSYEVGPDKTATLESILNLLQVNKNMCMKTWKKLINEEL